LVVAGLPQAVDLVPLLPRGGLVYHCADDYAHAGGFPSTLPQLEAALCRQADLVITTSETLCDERRRFNPNTYWIPNGADITHFAQPAQPAADLDGLPRPIVGFIGGISEWVDIELLAELGRARQKWTFVLIGPAAVNTAELRLLPNMRLLGPRAYADLPRYMAGMDVGVIPFKRSALTYHADPIKAYEYLAAGLPVVATELPALRRLAHVLSLADSVASWLAALDRSIAKGRDHARAERQAEAAGHSWTASFERLEQLIDERVGQCGS
jgi:glycosyltransferase involved in cell wall biosynthesis